MTNLDKVVFTASGATRGFAGMINQDPKEIGLEIYSLLKNGEIEKDELNYLKCSPT